MSSTRLAYRPSLDGLRALAVVAVLLFHAEVSGFSGGYLGVSLFFTLSGYLITRLLLSEEERDGTIDLAGFYTRRAKRLLPASTACLIAVAIVASTTDWFAAVADLRRDVIGAALQVANWVFLAGEGSYQDLFADSAGQASPVEHYWSLAIEEQFYWLWPIIFVLVARRVRTPRHRLTVVAWATAVAALVAPLTAAVWGGDAAYWATPARASEILVGAVVAVVVHGRHLSDVDQRVWRWAAPVGLGFLAAGVVLFPSSGGPAFAGFLPLVGLTSGLVLIGLERSGPALTHRVLSSRPLVGLGRISYGVYLFHWPIFVLVDQPRVDADGATLLVLRLGLTLAMALMSYFALERPVRSLRAPRPRNVASWSVGATVVTLTAALVLIPAGVGEYWRSPTIADAVSAASIEPIGTAELAPLVKITTPAPTEQSTSSVLTPTTDSPPPTPTLPRLERPVRVVVAGDSTAEALGAGLAVWAGERPDLAQVSLLATAGCGFLLGGEINVGEWRPVAPACEEWFASRFVSEVAKLQPDVVMLHTTSWDVLDRRWSDGTARTPLDPVFRGRLVGDFRSLTERLLESGVRTVVWVRQPVPNVYWLNGGQAQEDPLRHDVVYETVDEVASAQPLDVKVVDLPGWLAGEGLIDDQDARPDGVHWSNEAASRIARDYLGEQLIRAALKSG